MEEYRPVPYPPCQSGSCNTRECCASGWGRGTKYVWPELVGKEAHHAKAVIESQYRIVKVLLVPPGGIVMDDFCCNRVYVYLDHNNRVTHPPLAG